MACCPSPPSSSSIIWSLSMASDTALAHFPGHFPLGRGRIGGCWISRARRGHNSAAVCRCPHTRRTAQISRDDSEAPDWTMNLVSGSSARAGSESYAAKKVSILPTWKLAIRVDSSGISRKFIVANSGVFAVVVRHCLKFPEIAGALIRQLPGPSTDHHGRAPFLLPPLRPADPTASCW